MFFLLCTSTIAAVKVDLPWSTWPMVPTFTCGLVLWNVSFAIKFSCVNLFSLNPASLSGAHDQDRTDDLVLTKDVLCQLSYMGIAKAIFLLLTAQNDKNPLPLLIFANKPRG